MSLKIVLASTSRYRVAQLQEFGLKFQSRSPRVDEERLKKSLRLPPRALSRRLALEKAKSLTTSSTTDVAVIGADQLLNFKGHTLGKPGNRAANIKMLSMLQNKTHELITSVALVHGRRSALGTVTAKITLRKLSKKEIVRYVDRDRAFDCAGGYKFEKSGFGLVESVRVSDPSSLIGLGLITLRQLFFKLDIPMTYRHER
jgi:septum formation protein